MKQYANFIKVIPSFNVQSIIDGTITLQSGKTFDEFPTFNDVEPKEEPVDTKAGLQYDIELTVGIERTNYDNRENYTQSAPVIIVIYDDDKTNEFIIGDLNNPAKVFVTPNRDIDEFNFQWISKNPVL